MIRRCRCASRPVRPGDPDGSRRAVSRARPPFPFQGFALLLGVSSAPLLFLSLFPSLPASALTGEERTAAGDGAGPSSTGGEAPAAPAGADRSKALPIYHLRDGGRVTGEGAFKVLTVRTRYGVLRVPAAELVQVRFARRIDPEVDRRIEASLRQMGSDDFDEREDAMEAIRAIGPDALPRLRDAKDSDNEEIKNRAGILVEELESQESEARAEAGHEMNALPGSQDEVVTRRFTFKGRVVDEAFTVRSRYGPLGLSASDLVGIFFQHGGKTSRTVEVAGSRTVPSSWVKTKVTLRKGQRVRITADGQLHVSNYRLTSGPAGTRRYSGSSFQNLPMLALVGKVGAKGKPFLVGAEYKGKVPRGGALHLGVVPFRSYAATGTYKVKIEAGY